MSDLPRLTISNPPGRDSVQLDGRSIATMIKTLTLVVDGHGAHASLTLIGVHPAFDSEARVSLSEETADLLVQLGWTPPKGEGRPVTQDPDEDDEVELDVYDLPATRQATR